MFRQLLCILALSFMIINPVLGNSSVYYLRASYYSNESLKKEGTWKKSKGIMANGQKYDEKAYTCATRLFPLGAKVKVTCLRTGKSVIVRVADRIGKRFTQTRIDLTPAAFNVIGELKQGLISVKVEGI